MRQEYVIKTPLKHSIYSDHDKHNHNLSQDTARMRPNWTKMETK